MKDSERRIKDMSSIDERMNPIVLRYVRRRMPDAEVADFDRAIWDLDLDSLDIAELVDALEIEFSVKSDLEQIDKCESPADITAYFRGLIGAA
jgi:acyl carrier protein